MRRNLTLTLNPESKLQTLTPDPPEGNACLLRLLQVERGAGPRVALENHARAVGEGIQATCWVAIAPTTADYVESFCDGSTFWANKVRVTYKRKGDEVRSGSLVSMGFLQVRTAAPLTLTPSHPHALTPSP